jgi:hypothetical protein
VIPLPDKQPRAVSKAATVVANREQDVAAAQERVQQTQRAIEAAVIEDRQLLADALDAGADNHATPREDEARAAVADVERLLAAEELRLSRARDALDAAIEKSLDEWELMLTQSTEEAERTALDLVGQLERAEQERARLYCGLYWVRARKEGRQLPNLDRVASAVSPLVINPMAGPTRHTVPELIAAVREGIQGATLAAWQAKEDAARLHVA